MSAIWPQIAVLSSMALSFTVGRLVVLIVLGALLYFGGFFAPLGWRP